MLVILIMWKNFVLHWKDHSNNTFLYIWAISLLAFWNSRTFIKASRSLRYTFLHKHYRTFHLFLQKIQGTVDNTSMNPRLFKESILLISSGSIWARDKFNTNFRILISRTFRWTSQIFTPTSATADISKNMILSHLFDW